MIVSFAFIFLLSVSVVSAGWFSDLFSVKTTGDAVITGYASCPNCASDETCSPKGVCVKSSASARTSSTAKLRSSALKGWTEVDAADGSKCYVKVKKGKATGSFFGLVVRN